MRNNLGSLRSDQSGFVLVLALMFMALLSALAAAYSMTVKNDVVLTGGAARERNGFYAAEAGLNVGMAETLNLFNNFNIPDSYGSLISIGTGSTERTANYQLNPVSGCAPCAATTIPAGQKFAGLNTSPYRYTVESNSVSLQGDKEAELGAEFDVHNIPVFQFLAFSADDIYLMPAPNMNLHGRIHTNGNLYLNVNSNRTLTIGDDQPDIPFVQVSAAGNIYRGGFKTYTGNICTGTVIIDKLEDVASPSPDLDPRTLACTGSGPQTVPESTIDAYKGSLLNGIDSIQVPPVGTVDIGGPYWQKADLRIVLRLDGVNAFFSSCPGGPPGSDRYPIEVQTVNGIQDGAKTTSLRQFACERRGALFYNDVPVDDANNPHLANSYNPDFENNDRVYRRVGEDTSGNGLINNWDRNDDICPVGSGAAPWWKPSSCPWPNTSPISTSWFQDTDYRRGGFYHMREQMWMVLLNVNMRALIDWNEFNGGPLFAPGDTSDGGLVIFLSVIGPNSDAAVNNYGVRIFDSADLNTLNGTFPPGAADPTGLTVVSDQAIIVQGDYNERDWYPAAVMGDSLTILSQGWEVPIGGHRNDRKSVSSLASNRRDVPSRDGTTGPNSGCAPNGCVSFTGSTKLNFNAAVISGPRVERLSGFGSST